MDCDPWNPVYIACLVVGLTIAVLTVLAQVGVI